MTGLTPLSSGPIPLTLPAAWAWASFVLFGSLFIGFGLSAIADRVAEVTVPPDAVVFGSASVSPEPGWTVADRTPFSVTLDNQGVVLSLTSLPAEGSSALLRAEELAARMREEYRSLTVSSSPSPFVTDQGDIGQLIALAGSNTTAIAASVVDAGQAVDIESVGQSTAFGESLAGIDAMLSSIRIVAVAGDG